MTEKDAVFLKALAFQTYVRARKLIHCGAFVQVNQRTVDRLAAQYLDFPAKWDGLLGEDQ